MSVSLKLKKSGFDDTLLIQFKQHSEILVKNLSQLGKFGSALLETKRSKGEEHLAAQLTSMIDAISPPD